jgi:hypothetical protein
VKPEEALAVARAEAERIRALGGYAEGELPAPVATEPLTRERMLEFALIEPDPALVYSTRRGGAPITAVKRLLMRGLRQYHGQVLAQQTRFNLHVVAYLTELEERIERLEQDR